MFRTGGGYYREWGSFSTHWTPYTILTPTIPIIFSENFYEKNSETKTSNYLVSVNKFPICKLVTGFY
jgi:hypothetical protein